jgi:ATP-binding cassette subfamily B protein
MPESDVDAAERLRGRRVPRLIAVALRIMWSAGRTDLILATSLQLVSALGIAAILLLGRRALDVLLSVTSGEASMQAIVPLALAMGAVTAAHLSAVTVQSERQHILAELARRHVQGRLLDVTSNVDLVTFDDPEFHNRVQRIEAGERHALQLVFGLSGLIQACAGAVAAMTAVILVAPVLLPLLILVLVPAWFAASRRGAAFWEVFWNLAHRDRQRDYLGRLLRDRQSAPEIRAFGLAGYLRRCYEILYSERIRKLRRAAHGQIAVTLAANLTIGLVLAGILLLVVWLARHGTFTVATAGIAAAGIAVIGERLAAAGWAVGTLIESAQYVDDYVAFVALRPSPDRKPPQLPAPAGFERLAVRDVVFTYPAAGAPTLRGVCLDINAGEVVALVGENGSGKSTLARLLAGLYRPDVGTITWDGTDIGDWSPDAVRRRVAVIFQDYQRFHLTVGENIGFGRLEALDDAQAVQAAAVLAGADQFIERLPQRYHTVLGPEYAEPSQGRTGTDLSVGQWQRVALARAFHRDAPFVILDEPTAALDPLAELALIERIRALLVGRTVLFISHRLSSVRSADRIYMLAHGEVVESGTHTELMSLGGRYAELYTAQAAAFGTERSSW